MQNIACHPIDKDSQNIRQSSVLVIRNLPKSPKKTISIAGACIPRCWMKAPMRPRIREVSFLVLRRRNEDSCTKLPKNPLVFSLRCWVS